MFVFRVTFSSSDDNPELSSLLFSVSDSEDDFSSLSLASLSSSLSPVQNQVKFKVQCSNQ